MRKLTFEEIKKLKPSIEEVKRKKRNPVYAMLDNVRSLYNVGSVFRTSDAVLLNKLFLCGITGCPPRKEISKTALGAEDIVPWEQNDNPISVIEKLKKSGVQIAAVELTDKSVQYDKAKYRFPVCFIFGHEVEGISDEVVNMADICVSVPMLGRANSLNVASCFAVIMYDALRKIKK